jgi:hypothetical protein
MFEIYRLPLLVAMFVWVSTGVFAQEGASVTKAEVEMAEDVNCPLTRTAVAGAQGIVGALLQSVGEFVAPDIIELYGPTKLGPLPRETTKLFRGGSYSRVTVGSETTLYRVFGGNAGQLGSWWSRVPPAGPVQAQIDAALKAQWKNTAMSAVKIRVPGGTQFWEGCAAPQPELFGPASAAGALGGGGSQILVIGRINSAWIIP